VSRVRAVADGLLRWQEGHGPLVRTDSHAVQPRAMLRTAVISGIGLFVAALGPQVRAGDDPTISLLPSAYTNFESPQTNPLRLSPDGSRLFAANTASSSVSVFTLEDPAAPRLIAEIPVGIEPVSVWAISNDEVWVVNHVSDSISVVSVTRGIVTDTLDAGDEPSDIVVAGSPLRAYVSAARSRQLRVFDLQSRALVATVPLLGEHPRARRFSQGTWHAQARRQF
jgi:YVTN family beta-propeller protein